MLCSLEQVLYVNIHACAVLNLGDDRVLAACDCYTM